jgi:beta-galactosidase
VAAWVRRAGTPGAYRYIVSKGATACYASSYALYTGAQGSVAFYVFSSGHYTLSDQPAQSAVWDGRWHRLVGSYDGRVVRLYLDGRQVGDGVAEPGGIDYGLTSRGPYIGTYRGGCGLPFSGDIDTVEIYAAALSGAALAADAGLPAGSAPASIPGSGGGALPVPTAAAPGGGPVRAGCLSLQAEPRSLRAGRRTRIVARVRVRGRPRARVRLSLRGAMVRATAYSDRRGRARLRVRIPRAARHLTLSARACAHTATVTIPVRR